MGIIINEGKTKCMKLCIVKAYRRAQNIIFGDYSFEDVKYYFYLEFFFNNSINRSEKIKIMRGNRACCVNIKLLKSKLLSKASNMKLYKILIRPVFC